MSEDRPAPSPTRSPLRIGDEHARAGAWREAVDWWERAIQEDAQWREPVENRLRWLLQEAGEEPPASPSVTLAMVLGSGAAALIGTASVLFAGTPGTLSANVLAALAWVMFSVSAVLAIVAARSPGRTDALSSLTAQARQVAGTITPATVREEIPE